MSTSTANWFLPTCNWKRRTEDYALVFHRAAPIQHALRMHDRLPPIHYYNYQQYADFWPEHRYDFAPCGYSKLVYADVDQASPSHKDLVKKWAEEEDADVEDESVITEKQNLLAAARKKLGITSSDPSAQNNPDAGGSSATPPIPNDADPSWPDSAVLSELRHQISDPHSWILSYIMRLPTRSAKASVLRLLTEQSRARLVRPVLLLLDMMDSCQATKAGETRGWVSAYDLLDNLIVIKPFASRAGHHPLGDAWFGDVVRDGVSFKGSPQQLVQLVNQRDGFGAKDDPNRHFSQIVRMEAVGWVLEYAGPLGLPVDLDVKGTLDEDYEERQRSAWEKFARVKFPNQEKAGVEEGEDGEVKCLYEGMLAVLEDAEGGFRHAAVGARKEGREKVVRNLVGFWEGTMRELRGLMEEPGRE
ncbi:MAG: hypothetical protein FRX48_05444 [Lasallia pustulata]|uniref:Uncharacterized protein n=1 Tax=Lasallia pustulata TaxID=136370 RepID=A0A5M8PQB4_9LECA|nr:MAG: hypothetical protein FRX48_05444 [Lasallia pustulata]